MKHQNLPLVALASALAVGATHANTSSDQLEEVQVTASAQEQNKKLGEIKKNRQAIQEEMITDTRDLVRYTTDVGISDSGRHNKGFAMRGVEGNRVGISVDGVNLPDSEENSLYARYGNFNTSRLTIDPELVRGIDVVRGSDSFTTGSGSLGGGVNYKTLDATDIVFPENKIGVLLKNAYSSKNREWIHSAGVAYKGEQLDAVYLYSTRYGHELKSLSDVRAANNRSSGQPDPSFHRNHSNLVKVGYLFNEKHRLSASYSNQLNTNFTEERTYNWSNSIWRDADDIGERHNLNLAYEYFPTDSHLAYLKTEYDFQKTDVRAIGYLGYRNSLTYVRTSLDEIKNRNMTNEFHRITVSAEAMPIETKFGSHTLKGRAAISQREMENENYDTFLNYSSLTASTVPSSIQHPVKNQAFYVALQDDVQWNERFSSNFGLRYDQERLAQQDLKLNCNACAKEKAPATTFKNLTGSLGLTAKLNETWNASYYFSTGFRTPSASEMHFTYQHPAGSWLSNPYLKSERSENHAITIRGENPLGKLDVNLYQLRYKDFLFEQEVSAQSVLKDCDFYCRYWGFNPNPTTRYMQMVNLDKAKISGLEVAAKLNLHEAIQALPKGLSVMGNLGYSKGKLYGTEASLLSIQPIKVILGISYEDPENRWGVHSRWTYLGAKKAKDATYISYKNGVRSVTPFPYLNSSASLFDVYGFVNFGKHVTLRAGVYNVFNRKYTLWDSLRGINTIGLSNTVDDDKVGLARYIAPGRNFAGSVEIRF